MDASLRDLSRRCSTPRAVPGRKVGSPVSEDYAALMSELPSFRGNAKPEPKVSFAPEVLEKEGKLRVQDEVLVGAVGGATVTQSTVRGEDKKKFTPEPRKESEIANPLYLAKWSPDPVPKMGKTNPIGISLPKTDERHQALDGDDFSRGRVQGDIYQPFRAPPSSSEFGSGAERYRPRSGVPTGLCCGAGGGGDPEFPDGNAGGGFGRKPDSGGSEGNGGAGGGRRPRRSIIPAMDYEVARDCVKHDVHTRPDPGVKVCEPKVANFPVWD